MARKLHLDFLLLPPAAFTWRYFQGPFLEGSDPGLCRTSLSHQDDEEKAAMGKAELSVSHPWGCPLVTRVYYYVREERTKPLCSLAQSKRLSLTGSLSQGEQ